MRGSSLGLRRLLAVAWLCVVAFHGGPTLADPTADQIKRGAYIAAAGGCFGCHTDVKAKTPPYAGGAALKTPFGAFYAPNITPHREHGIGAWREADFIRAMREGIAPDGSHYFPTFPYTSFTNITGSDLKALRAYLFSLPPIARPDKAHDIAFPFSWRFLQTFWKWLNFIPGPFKAEPTKSAMSNRGAYLVEALVHCGECHTPRNALGGLDRDKWLAGTPDGPEGELAPNITPDEATGISKWRQDEVIDYLKIGLDPEGDFAGSLMAVVIEHSTSKLTDSDLEAVVVYLKALSPIRNKVSGPPK